MPNYASTYLWLRSLPRRIRHQVLRRVSAVSRLRRKTSKVDLRASFAAHQQQQLLSPTTPNSITGLTAVPSSPGGLSINSIGIGRRVPRRRMTLANMYTALSLPLGHGRRSSTKTPKRASSVAQPISQQQRLEKPSSPPNRVMESAIANMSSPPQPPMAMMNSLLNPVSIPLPPTSSNHSQPSPAVRPQTLVGSPASRNIKTPTTMPAVLAPRRQPPPPPAPAPLLSQPTLAPSATARLTPPSAPPARLTPPPPPPIRKSPSPRVQPPPLHLPTPIPVSQVPPQYRSSLSSQRPVAATTKRPQHERRVSTGSENSDSDNINPSSRIPPPGLGDNNMMGIQHSKPTRGYTSGYGTEKDKYYSSSSSSDRDRKEREKKSRNAAYPHPAPVYVNTTPHKPTRPPPPPPVQTQAPPPSSFVRPPPSAPRNVRFRNTLQFSATPPGSIPPSPTHSRRHSRDQQRNLHPLTGTNTARNAASPNTSPSHKPLHPLTPTAYPVTLPTPAKRKGWFNAYGEQLWTNEGGYVAPPPGMENPPDLAGYPQRGKGWMNEDGRVIDMQHRLLRDGWGAGNAKPVAPVKKEAKGLKSALKKRS